MRRVGILGGGQLCLMLAESLHRLGADVVVLDPDAGAPAHRRLPGGIVAPLDDAAALEALCARVDVVTYEFENVPSAPLRPFEGQRPFWPSVDVLMNTQDRAREKCFLDGAGFPCVPHRVVPDGGDLAAAVRALGFPSIIKTARGGYDGKGQTKISDEATLAARLPRGPQPGGWVVERAVDIATEVSCIVARDARGGEAVFPIFENLHRDHVLDFTLLPARVSPAVAERAREIGLGVARALGVVGLITVEFFVTTDGGIYVNELAPRPHNSGHVTRAATSLSQFDALARVLVGAPLVTPTLAGPGFAMANLLGEVWLAQGAPSADDLALDGLGAIPEVRELYLYGKRGVKAKRKMGHLVAAGRDADDAMANADRARAALSARVVR